MSEKYVREKLSEAIAIRERNIADLKLQLARRDSPELRRELEHNQTELMELLREAENKAKTQAHDEGTTRGISLSQDKASSPSHSNKPPDQISSDAVEDKVSLPSHPPSQIFVVLTLGLLFVLLVSTLTFSANYLKDPQMVLIVFLVSLIVLVVLLPFIGLSTQMIREETWFKTYLAALVKIPGLDVLINSMAQTIRLKTKNKNSKPPSRSG